MTSLFTRVGAWFLEPPPPNAPDRRLGERAAPADPPVPATRFLPPGTTGGPAPVTDASHAASTAPASADAWPDADASPDEDASRDLTPAASAAVLGAPGPVVPLAAACAGELRTRARAAAALLCIWRPAPQRVPGVEPTASPAGATTPGARRLAARLVAHELSATACGRLAWLSLEHDAEAAAEQVRRCLRIAGMPVVLAVAGARPPAFEPLLAELGLAVAVLRSDIDAALRELALATLPARGRAVLVPLPPGPPRWAAMAGLARLRSLPRGEA